MDSREFSDKWLKTNIRISQNISKLHHNIIDFSRFYEFSNLNKNIDFTKYFTSIRNDIIYTSNILDMASINLTYDKLLKQASFNLRNAHFITTEHLINSKFLDRINEYISNMSITAFEDFSDAYDRYIEASDTLTISIDESIATAKDKISVEDVKTLVNECLFDNNIPQGINKLLETAQKNEHNKILRYIIFALIIPYIFPLIMNYYISTGKNFINQQLPTKNIVKNIKKTTELLQLDREFYTSYRFVTERILVYNTDSMSSRIVGELNLGEIVYIVHKKRNWCLVEYVSENGDIRVRGWVLTRYIARFK